MTPVLCPTCHTPRALWHDLLACDALRRQMTSDERFAEAVSR